MITYIYILYDPTFISEKFYVGKTIDPHKRYKAHLQPKQLQRKNLKNNWIKSLLKRSIKPKMSIVFNITSNQDWKQVETSLISFLKFFQIKLVNTTPGGETGSLGHKHKKSTKKKISIVRLNTSQIKIGDRYGKLTVLRSLDVDKRKSRRHLWVCQCDCGTITEVTDGNLVSNNTKSCGCLHLESKSLYKAKSKIGYKGVQQKYNKYAAAIRINKKAIHLGTFTTPEEAAKAYDAAARQFFGINAALNFPMPGEKSAL